MIGWRRRRQTGNYRGTKRWKRLRERDERGRLEAEVSSSMDPEEMEVEVGLLQGSALSPFHFHFHRWCQTGI